MCCSHNAANPAVRLCVIPISTLDACSCHMWLMLHACLRDLLDWEAMAMRPHLHLTTEDLDAAGMLNEERDGRRVEVATEISHVGALSYR
jgi:hypothetical protein